MVYSRIAIIPARGGSKRIPGKNIRGFMGKPIIAITINNLLESRLFDKIIVSTDSEEIAKIAISYGAEVPFLRSAENSSDNATTFDVLKEVTIELNRINIDYTSACVLYPTSVFSFPLVLNESYSIFSINNYSTLMSVVRFGYPPQRGLRIYENKVSMINQENIDSRSQDLEPIYHDTGQLYWYKRCILDSGHSLFTLNTGCIVLKENEVQDIDNESDWKIAEIKYSIINGSS